MENSNILLGELKGSFEYFFKFTNLEPNSPGFGLSLDSTKNPHIASIASVGFALTAWVIASERGFIGHQKALEITKKTLHTLCFNVSHYRGFFAHFVDLETGQRVKKCEYSTIDTALCLNGVITAAAYFRDGEITQLAEQMLERVDWNFLVFEEDGKTVFRMAYNPDRKKDEFTDPAGLFGQWDMAAEQKMMYLQAAARIEPSTARKLYQGFRRDIGYFDGQKIIINPGGTLFVYQFSEAWLDTANYLDPDGIDWFNNTRLAALANRSFCMDHSNEFKTYHEKSWGSSAGDSPWGYDVSGSTPSLDRPKPNGTVSIYGAVSCLPFIPDLAMDMIQFLYHNHPQAWGPYGFYDSYNLNVVPPWYSKSIYGIDKGCSMIMVENYLSRLIWETYTNSPTIQKSLSVLGFTRRAP